ncbi:MAG: HEAT repeat domain-containing protein [Gemmatimonadota bacterium]|nr:MAG: HEAT repeat domain-containing protein [Gemmatimonadota bacterium]
MRPTQLAGAALMVAAAASHAQAQSIARQIDRAPDGRIRMSFETRPEVCGTGRSIGEETADGFVLYTFGRDYGYSIQTYDDWLPNCEHGPLRLVVTKRGGRIVDLAAAVGVEWQPDAAVPDLGMVEPAAAASWLLDVAAEGNDDVGRIAFLAADAAANAEIADRLLAMAQDRRLDSDVRERAMRWVNRAAAREAKSDAADEVLRNIAESQDDVHDVRERAIRTLRQTAANDAYLRTLYSSLDDRELKERVIRRLGESPTVDNVQWIAAIAITSGESLVLRERAIRVIGAELDRPDDVRDMFDRLDHRALKERALRVVAEQTGSAANPWLRTVAADRGQAINVRDRAVRMLGERATGEELLELYRELDAVRLRERVVRIAGEMQTPASREWLRSVALDQNEHSQVRDRAVRILCDGDGAEARTLFDRLESVQLKDRALRMAGAARDPGTNEWLRDIALDETQRSEFRDRAIRILADRAMASVELAELYDRLDRSDLRRRVIRILADRGDEQAIEKLIAIAQSDPDADLRRYAVRRLGEVDHPKAREFLEGVLRSPRDEAS